MSYIPRRTMIRRRRNRARRNAPTKAEIEALRQDRYMFAGGRCEIRLHKECWGDRVLPWSGDVFGRAHLAHRKSRGAGGKFTFDNVVIGCPACHLGSVHTEGKKIPCTPPCSSATFSEA